MSNDGPDGKRPNTGARLFIVSCVVGFFIISGCVAYFIAKFFL
jgi:phage shock protein PspC (stress-responsive transcriptional regulator)